MPKYKTSTNTDPLKAMYGENSQGVGALQAQLNQKYAGQAGFVPLKVDNKFGPLTQAAMNFKPTTTADKNTPIGQISTVGMDNGNDYYGSIMEKQARGEDIVDTGRIRSDILSRFQDRINATNDIYNRQLAAARQEGVGRVGSGTSLLAARGLTGSMRGGAIKENILDQNRQIEGAIDAERNAAIQNILGMAEQSAIEEAARRREAIQSGASNYINYVKSQGETKRANLENVAGQLIVQGIDPAQLDANYISKLAKDIGVSTNDIMSAYKTAQYKASQGEGFEKTLSDIKINVAQSDAPNKLDLLTRLSTAKNTDEALKIAGQYSGDYLKAQLLKEQIKTERAQRDNYNASAAKTRSKTGGGTGNLKLTDAQVQNAGFADRINQANTIIDNKADTFKNLNYAQFKLLESKSPLANSLLSSDHQEVAQAMRNFITAKLRKESGAAISPTEFEDARLTYFPTLNDSDVVLQNKKNLRDSVLNNLVLGSGGAYTAKTSTAETVPNKFQQAIGQTNQTFNTTNLSVKPDGSLDWSLPGVTK